MKKYFTAVTILAFTAVLLIGLPAFSDETRAQFERSSREKATVNLFRDKWDEFIDFPWISGTMTNENYLWTNLANLQSDKTQTGTVNKDFRNNGYNWSRDEKENILGNPPWDTNNSFALGYLGNPVGTEGWNVGFIYNYQTFDYNNELVNSGFSRFNNSTSSYEEGTVSADQSYDNLEHIWVLNGGIVLSEELGLGISWYHWNTDEKWRTRDWTETWNSSSGHSYMNKIPEYNYSLKDQGDTISLGAYFQVDPELAISGVFDLDYKQVGINWDSSQVTSTSLNDTSGIDDKGNFVGSEDRSDFGFDFELEAIKKWDSDFWKRTEFYAWVGYHPLDGNYFGNNENFTNNTHSVFYDVDGDISNDDFNWGVEARSFINFGDRIRFAWALSFAMDDTEYKRDFDWVNYPGTANSSTTSNEYKEKYVEYYWSVPVALEIDFVKNLTGRIGARWILDDFDGDNNPYTNVEGYGNFEGFSGWQSDETNYETTSRNTTTVYSFGLGWAFNEYLQIDVTDFTDLTNMNDWQLSLTLKW